MDSADSSAASRALADAATATGRAQQQKPKRIRREGRALNNVISIIEEDVQGQRGRVELIREHPCETTTNYAGAVSLRCNLDAQSLVRLPPLSVFDSGPLPTIGPKSEWAFMNKDVPHGSPTNLIPLPELRTINIASSIS